MKTCLARHLWLPVVAIASIAWQAGHGESADSSAVIPYLAHCALAAGQSRVVDGVAHAGAMGLAPAWGERPMTRSERGFVSACLMALTNAYGAHVEVSLRPANGAGVDASEREAFPLAEGAFFGEVFEAPRRMYACSGDAPPDDLPMQRACTVVKADGRATECGFTHVGSCAEICADRDAAGAFGDCTVDGVTYAEVVTAFTRRR